jgi:hypothetical protein
MRKVLLSMLVMFAFTAATFAQTPVTGFEGKKSTDEINFDMKLHKENMRTLNSKNTESRWYNYAFALDDILGGIASLSWNNLFPDSTILVDYSSGYGGTWIHLLGNTLDPKSDWFNDPGFFPGELYINEHMPYTVDTVGMQFYYWRNHPDPTIVDTLIFEVFTNNVSSDMPIYFFGPTSSVAGSYGVDTLRFGAYLFNAHDLSSKATSKRTYKFPLTEAFANDTLDDGSLIAYISTADMGQIDAGKLVGVTANFKPGYSWNPNLDTLVQKNRLVFLSYEENGEETWSNFTKGDYNESHIATPSSFDPASSWYEFQIPEWAFTAASFSYENHLFYYKLTADVSGIGVERPTENTVSLSQNHPNPFSNTTSVRYTLNEATNVSFDLFDQTGRMVMSINRGVEAAGMQTIDIDANDLSNGIYFYTLTAGNQKATKKMVVVK